MIGDRINATIAYHLERGLPDGRKIDNLVALAADVLAIIHGIVSGLNTAGEIVIEMKAAIGPPIVFRIKLRKVE